LFKKRREPTGFRLQNVANSTFDNLNPSRSFFFTTMKKLDRILKISTLVFSLWACDEIKEVPSPQNLVGTALLNSTIIAYSQPNNFVAFDTKKLLDKVQGFTSLKMESTPKFGFTYFSKSGLLIYKSDSTTNEAIEELVYKVFNSDASKVKRDTLKIIITSDFSKTPCNAGAIPDIFSIEINKPSILNVLKNDRFCSSTLDSATLQVVDEPMTGSAIVENNRIKYTPKVESDKSDYFLYRVCTGGKSPMCMFAGVRVDIRRTICQSVLVADSLVIDKNSILPLSIKVLANDKICDNYNKKSLAITVQPLFGTAIVNKNYEIEYTPNTNKPALDLFEYSIWDNNGKNPLKMFSRITIL